MNDNRDASEPTPSAAHGNRAEEGSAAAIDVEKLADRVYNLMLDELRLEKARGINGNSFRRN
jgi:hypothetical protein